MKKSSTLILAILMVSVVIFSCKSKKTGCDAYGQNGSVKKSIEQTR